MMELLGAKNFTDQAFIDVGHQELQLDSVQFQNCVFQQSTFHESEFLNCSFWHCRFEDCDLSLLQIPGTRFRSTEFIKSKVIGIDWTRGDWSERVIGKALYFDACELSYSTFLGLELDQFECLNSVCREVDFRETDLTAADFSGTDLEGSIFLNTNLVEADLRLAKNYSISPETNNLSQAKFSFPEAMSLLYNLDINLED